MSTQQLILELKENNQDFEFYPTTDEMLKVVVDDLIRRDKSIKILDIGCGNAKLKSLLSREIEKIEDKYKRWHFDYFGIEKSEILIQQLPDDVYILGTDFNQTTLIDKITDVIFCNPPYSEFENWMTRIICEGNFKTAYLVVPTRWAENKEINQALSDMKITTEILYTGDFTHAERQARATVNIVKLNCHRFDYWNSVNDEETFKNWFDKTFNVKSEEKLTPDYEVERKNKEKLKNEIVAAPNKIEYLVNMYNDELGRLFNTFSQLCNLDEQVLNDVGINFEKVRTSLKEKIRNHKVLYWNILFDELDEITSRLTAESRRKLKDQFAELSSVEFNASNIRSVVIWVLKNASKYFSEQLVELYKTLSCYENVIKYKSNQRVFSRDDWGWRRSEVKPTHYCLSYRLVVDSLYFRDSCSRWNPVKKTLINDYEVNKHKVQTVVDDLCAIANNLGFTVKTKEYADEFGEKFYIYGYDNTKLIEYKLFKNGNTHIKLDIEFMKAINVEVARLLGWIRNKADIAEEFPEEMAKGAEKYFKTNFAISLENPNIKLLTAA